MGRCGAEESEPTLVAWLAGARDQAVAASFALGDLATSKQKLREETLAALLNVAAGSAAAPPVPEALFPVGRLEHVPLTVLDRIREVATARLAAPGEARFFAVRALGRAGDGAAGELGRLLATRGSFTAAERAEAARGLARLGKVGQRALAAALPGLVPASDPVSLTGLVGEDFGVLLTTLESLTDRLVRQEGARRPRVPPAAARRADPGAAPRHRAPLHAAAKGSRRRRLPRQAPGRLRRHRFGTLQRTRRRRLCDRRRHRRHRRPSARRGDRPRPHHRPSPRRLPRARPRKDLRAREAALELLAEHEEVEGAPALLAEALAAREPGLVSTAAEVLTKQPQRR